MKLIFKNGQLYSGKFMKLLTAYSLKHKAVLTSDSSINIKPQTLLR